MKALLTSLSLFILFLSAGAQDSIRTIQGRVIPAAVKSVTPYQISYRKYEPGLRFTDSTSRAVHKISVSKVTEVMYADGRRVSTLPVVQRRADSLTRSYFYALGENDAKLYYRKYKPAATATFLATFPGSPLLGLMVAITTSSTKPSSGNFTYPNEDMLSSIDYKAGYAKKARQMKTGKVWTSWGIGTLITGIVVLAVRGVAL